MLSFSLQLPSVQVIPTEDEVALLTRYEGPPSELSAPEQFLATMAQLPRLRNKIQVSACSRTTPPVRKEDGPSQMHFVSVPTGRVSSLSHLPLTLVLAAARRS